MCLYTIHFRITYYLFSIYRAHKPIIPQVYFVDCFTDCVDPHINWYLYNSEWYNKLFCCNCVFLRLQKNYLLETVFGLEWIVSCSVNYKLTSTKMLYSSLFIQWGFSLIEFYSNVQYFCQNSFDIISFDTSTSKTLSIFILVYFLNNCLGPLVIKDTPV